MSRSMASHSRIGGWSDFTTAWSEPKSLIRDAVLLQVWVADSRCHLVLANIHHCITDGWSASLLQRELYDAFTAVAAGSTPAWTPLPVQMVDYAAWQREHITGTVLDARLEWWQTTLKGAPPLLELPWDHPRPALASHAGAAAPLQVPPDVAKQLQDLAAAEHTTLFSVALTAIQVCCCTGFMPMLLEVVDVYVFPAGSGI